MMLIEKSNYKILSYDTYNNYILGSISRRHHRFNLNEYKMFLYNDIMYQNRISSYY